MAILNIVTITFILSQVLSRHRPAHLKEKHAFAINPLLLPINLTAIQNLGCLTYS